MHARTHGRTDARMHGRTHAMADAESTTRREITLFLYPLKQHINYFITSPPPPSQRLAAWAYGLATDSDH